MYFILFMDLCYDEEVPQLNLILQQLLSPSVLNPKPILEDAHVLLRVAINGEVHQAHLDTQSFMGFSVKTQDLGIKRIKQKVKLA